MKLPLRKLFLRVAMSGPLERDPIPDFNDRVRYEKLRFKKKPPQAVGLVLK